MALVDYSSSAESDSDSGRQPAKRHRSCANNSSPCANNSSPSPDKYESASAMPPLPAAFHDLYASTVRYSVVDDPSLHQGRKRQIPHVRGQWPSHVYIEWHPTPKQHHVLCQVIDAVAARLIGDIKLHSLLTSDLGAPLPLHISLSRPLCLPSAEKDAFLDQLKQALSGPRSHRGQYKTNDPVFTVRPTGLAWFASPESDRTFLVLRVASAGDASPELTALLARCNSVATQFKQPPLYGNKQCPDASFHISIGWILGQQANSPDLAALMSKRPFSDTLDWEIGMAGVKAKIGNVVSHIPLSSLVCRSAGRAC